MKTESMGAVAKWAALAVLTAMLACTTDYVTGKKTFSLVSESQEIEMGKEADPEIVAEYGLYDDADLAKYVNGIGQAIAGVSQRQNLTYTVRVVDTPVVNAFAIPGGYVYITRGILAHFNSEDELAGVMGHEIGHVVARHSAEQMSRAQLASLGLELGAVMSEKFARFAEAAGVGVQLLFLKFSRAQESEADMLGVEYSTRIGYDAHKMADFFKTLEVMSSQSGQTLPTFLSTHPDPGDREVRVNQLAGEWQQKVPYRPLERSRYEYLKRIDGIVYGDDPRQGFVEKGVFFHPQMKFQFPVPAGWKVQNSAATVVVVQPDQKAVVQFTMGKEATAGAAADDFVTSSGVTVTGRATKTVGGHPAVVVESTLDSKDGTLSIASCFIERQSAVFVFHGFAATSDFPAHSAEIRTTMDGFRDLTDPGVLNRQPRRVSVEQAKSAGTMGAVLRIHGVAESAVDEIALVNGRSPEDRVEKGEWLKIVRQ